MRRVATILSLLFLDRASVSVASPSERGLQQVSNDTLATIITTEADLAILTTLVERTGLLGLTQDASIDPLTIFAPSNDAFLNLTRDNELLANRVLNRDDFGMHRLSLLLTHVAEGKFFVSDFINGQVVAALNVENLTIGVDILDALTVTSASSAVEVFAGDFEAVNGVVHKADGVLLPFWWQADLDVVIASLAPKGYSVIDGLFLQVGGIGEFVCEGSIGTVFLPDDTALGAVTVDDVYATLQNHIVLGVHTSMSLKDGDVLTTLAGNELSVTFGPNDSLVVGGATVLSADHLANDGIVHGISVALLDAPMTPVVTPVVPTVPAPLVPTPVNIPPPVTSSPVPPPITDPAPVARPDPPTSSPVAQPAPPMVAPTAVLVPLPTMKVPSSGKGMGMRMMKKKRMWEDPLGPGVAFQQKLQQKEKKGDRKKGEDGGKKKKGMMFMKKKGATTESED